MGWNDQKWIYGDFIALQPNNLINQRNPPDPDGTF